VSVAVEFTLTTPALLFSAISLLLLAYGNRFLTLANLIRDLYARYKAQPDPRIRRQLDNLSLRIGIIRDMQVFGVASFLACVLCMFILFLGYEIAGKWIFGIGLVLLMISLLLGLRELQISVDALRVQIQDLDEIAANKPGPE
jgi:hypothetical protein